MTPMLSSVFGGQAWSNSRSGYTEEAIDGAWRAGHDTAMATRIVISGLWFLSIWGLGGLVSLMLDVPRALTLPPAIAIAVAWWWVVARAQLSKAGAQTATQEPTAQPVGELRSPAW